MPQSLKFAYRREFAAAKQSFAIRDYDASFRSFERAHILGQRFFWAHLITHWWMLRIAMKRMDGREIVGQVLRIIATVPGYLFGWIPVGNTGGANVSAVKPMPIPSDLSEHFVGYSVWRGVRLRLLLVVGLVVAALAWWHLALQRRIAILDTQWSHRQVTRVAPFGATARLRVLPLVNWHAARPVLQTEAGVSLLVRTDLNTMQVDFGDPGRRRGCCAMDVSWRTMRQLSGGAPSRSATAFGFPPDVAPEGADGQGDPAIAEAELVLAEVKHDPCE